MGFGRFGRQEFELDGLLLVDRLALTVEVKAGRYTQPARRAAPDRLRRDLQDLIVAAHDQARRARAAVLDSRVSFCDADGRTVSIDRDRIAEVVPLTVTLDELGVSPIIWELARARVLQPGEQHPTTMSLYDLEIACDLLDRPSVFLHYLRRRQTLNQIGRVMATEEADLVMYYFDQGLYLEAEDVPSLTILPSLTDPVDAYYLYHRGGRQTPAKKPTLRPHPELDRLIGFLESQRPPGWTVVTSLLLDMAADAQNDLGQQIARMRIASRRDGMPHDLSFAIDNPSRGLTVVTLPDDDLDQLREYVELLSLKNKHLNRASSWSGIGIFARRSEPFHLFLHDPDPWEPNAELDEAIAGLQADDEGS